MKPMDVVKIVGIIGAGVVAYKFATTLKAVGGDVVVAAKKVITEDLNPASDKNIVYSAVNSVGSTMTGDSSFSLGGWIYDKLNKDPVAIVTGKISDPSNVSQQGKQITSGENAKTAFQLSEKRSLSYITGVTMQDGDDSTKNIVNGINFNNF
jgi:hypothetical protein